MSDAATTPTPTTYHSGDKSAGQGHDLGVRVIDTDGLSEGVGEQKLRKFNINFGPQHPAAHGVLRLVLELDGEVVERVDPHIGLLHRGTEKLMEWRPYMQTVPYFDRLDYVAPMSQEHGYCLAIERLMNVTVPRRAQLIRVLYLEISRIKSHLLNVGAQAGDVGAITPQLWLFEEREKLMVFYERASGARLHANYFRPGGVHQDLPPELVADIAAWCDPFLKILDDTEGLITENRIFKQRNVDIGVVTREQALAWGFTGPCCAGRGAVGPAQEPAVRVLRGDGFRHRRGQERRLLGPLPRAHRGDEAVGAHHAQCCEKLRSRRAGADRGRQGGAPTRGNMKRSMEALIHHFKLYTEGYHVPAGEIYAAVEAPKGEFGVYLVSDGSNKPTAATSARRVRAPAGYGLDEPRPHAGGRQRHPRVVGHRLRRD
jgi:NADH-quinone oxidoreductase subunit D